MNAERKGGSRRFRPSSAPADSRSTATPPGATATLVERISRGAATPTAAPTVTKRQPSRRPATERPSWQLGPDPLGYEEVELLDRGFVDYKVSLGSSARKDIRSEIDRAHQAAGEAVEAAGWLFGQYRPRADGRWTEIALATRSIERSVTSGEVYLSDPMLAIDAVRNAGWERMELIGDWHSHCVAGSELPSLQDAKAWAGTMDKLARDAYVSLVVSPLPDTGWMYPKFTAWVAGRYGVPSRPVVGRARLNY